MTNKLQRTLVIILIITLTILLVNIISTYGINPLKESIHKIGIWAPIGIFLLRGVSIIIPLLPSTAYSILAGALLGFYKGLIIIIITDVIWCNCAYWIGTKLRKDKIKRLIGKDATLRIEKIKRYKIENNIFIMTGIMMTGLFDFASYALGMGGASWKMFESALLVSVIVSTPPIVAIGAGILNGGKLYILIACIGFIGLGISRNLTHRYIRNK